VRSVRELVTAALQALQRILASDRELSAPLEHVAAAASALYAAEAESKTVESVNANLRAALDELTRAHNALRKRPPPDGGTAATAIAQALALLYPHVRSTERPAAAPRAVARDDRPARREAKTMLSVEAAAAARELRLAGQRITVEVDVGVLSESNFYAGVTADVSVGGVFVSTRDPLPVGTEVALYFTLAPGRTLHAECVVRWVRPAREHAEPGMGLAFTQVEPEDQLAIAEFCGYRAPLLYA
jgi:uncharacterized protein (TIGR02266 family)